MITIAATGHRPNKLGGHYDDHPAIRAELRKWLEYYQANYALKAVLSGMALGVDQIWAEEAIALGMPVIACLPCTNQPDTWPAESKSRYYKLLNQVSKVVKVHDGTYTPGCMQMRNEYMVDHCDLLVAVWDGTTGGTGNCVRYARKKRKPILRLWKGEWTQ